jgi:hypothetical protein
LHKKINKKILRERGNLEESIDVKEKIFPELDPLDATKSSFPTNFDDWNCG